MELGTLPDGGLVQATDQFLVSRAGAARRVSGSRFMLTDGSGNSVLAGDPRLTAGAIVRSGTAPLIGGNGGANTVVYTGTASFNVRNAADTATLFSITNGGAVTAGGSLNIVGAITQNGQQVYHSGNFNPAAYAALSGASFTGSVAVAGTLSSQGSIKENGAQVWHAGNLDPSNYAPLSGAAFTGPVSVAGSLSSQGSIKENGAQVWHTGNLNPSLYLTASPGSVLEIGQYLDFHNSNDTSDFSARLYTIGTELVLTGGFNAGGIIKQQGNPVFHTGNFNPASKQDALDYVPYNAANPAGYISGVSGAMVTSALGYTPYNSANPSGYISGITSSNVTTALEYTPYNATNPAGYISSITGGMVNAALGYVPANSSGQMFGGGISAPSVAIDGAFSLSAGGGQPTVTFDAGDGINFDRANNKFLFIIGNQVVASIDAAGNIRARGDFIGNVTP